MSVLLSIIMFLIIGLPLSIMAQQWHSRITLNSEMGYSTNSYLNDYLSEWEPSLSAPYGLISPEVQVSRYFGKNALSAAVGAYFQPYFESDYSSWRGTFGHLDINRRWNQFLYTGIQGGINRYFYTYSRTLGWIEPYFRFNISDDMEARLEWSATYRSYGQLPSDTSSNRYERIGLNYQWWPSYRWQIRTGVFGNIALLRGGDRALSGYLATRYWPKNDLNLNLRAGFERYGFETTSKRSVGPRCDILNGCSRNNRILISNQDDLYSLKLSGEYLMNPRWTLKASASYLRWITNRSPLPDGTTDVSFSVGVTYSIIPDWGGREKVQAPEIERARNKKTLFKIRYKGEADLYLTGDFNNWQRPGIPLIKGPDQVFRTTLKLGEGVYEYKILKIEGGNTEWLKLDDATIMVKDGFGGMNGRMVIE